MNPDKIDLSRIADELPITVHAARVTMSLDGKRLDQVETSITRSDADFARADELQFAEMRVRETGSRRCDVHWCRTHAPITLRRSRGCAVWSQPAHFDAHFSGGGAHALLVDVSGWHYVLAGEYLSFAPPVLVNPLAVSFTLDVQHTDAAGSVEVG